MYYWLPSVIWTNKDGTIDEIAKAKFDRQEKIYAARQLRNRRRINMVTLRFKPDTIIPGRYKSNNFLFKTLNSLLDDFIYEGLDKIPVVLYEPSISPIVVNFEEVRNYRYVNCIEYIFAFLREKKNRKYSYLDYKQAITDFVEYFSIPPSGPKTNMMEHFEDLNGNLYRYDVLFYHLCKYTILESRNQ